MTTKRDQSEAAESGRFAYEGLDRALHEKARLGILASLVAHPDGLRFSELRGLCARAGLEGVAVRRYAPLLRLCAVTE